MTSGFEALSAGARPATSPAARVTPTVNARTRASSLKSNARGMGMGRVTDMAARVSDHARTTPAAAPIAAMSRLSVTNCCTSRPWVAPMASRIPISL
jgi:hypothetical protein